MGVSMTLISVAGVTAHLLITAGPRRSRAERGSGQAALMAAIGFRRSWCEKVAHDARRLPAVSYWISQELIPNGVPS
jgi:hypothetical protein